MSIILRRATHRCVCPSCGSRRRHSMGLCQSPWGLWLKSHCKVEKADEPCPPAHAAATLRCTCSNLEATRRHSVTQIGTQIWLIHFCFVLIFWYVSVYARPRLLITELKLTMKWFPPPLFPHPPWFHCGRSPGRYWQIAWDSASGDSASSSRRHRSGLERNHRCAHPRNHTHGLVWRKEAAV